MLTTQMYTFVINVILSLVTILDGFAEILVILTNREKSIIIEFDPRGFYLPLRTYSLNFQFSTITCQYIGVLFGQQDALPAN